MTTKEGWARWAAGGPVGPLFFFSLFFLILFLLFLQHSFRENKRGFGNIWKYF
jgi:hypothetical protein